MVEPWDYRYATGRGEPPARAGFRQAANCSRSTTGSTATSAWISTQLGVVYDIKTPPGQVAARVHGFPDARALRSNGEWTKTIARVVGRYEDGGLGSLNELVHENGHAVHISAIRNRPAFTDWTDTIFTEAFADVPSWSVYEPAWQQKYLGTRAAGRRCRSAACTAA